MGMMRKLLSTESCNCLKSALSNLTARAELNFKLQGSGGSFCPGTKEFIPLHQTEPSASQFHVATRGFFMASISLEYLDASTVALLRRGGRGVYEMPFSSTYSIYFFMLPSLAEIHMLLLIFFPISLYFSPKDRVKINMLHTSIR